MKRPRIMGCQPAAADQVLVVGYGNPLRGDDGIGWRAASALAESIQDDRVQIVACVQLTPELADSMAQVDRVIFIDASIGLAPGQVRVTRLKSEELSAESWTHLLDPPSLIMCARVLYGRAPEAVMITMGVASYDCRDGLSLRIRERFPRLLARVREEIAGRPPGPEPAPAREKAAGSNPGLGSTRSRRKRASERARSTGSAHKHRGPTG